MLKKIAAFIVNVLLLANISFAQKPIYDAWGGNDSRYRASYGTVPDRIYDDIIKISQLNTKKVLIGNFISDAIGFVKNGNVKETKDFNYNLARKEDSILYTLIDSQLNYQLIDDLDKIRFPIKENGYLKINDKELWNYIQKKYDVDYMIFFSGFDMMDFLTRSNSLHPPQGLHKIGKNIYVYAGMQVEIIDLKKGKFVKNSRSPQSSADYSPFKCSSLSELTETDKKTLEDLIIARYVNNYSQLLRLLGVLKN